MVPTLRASVSLTHSRPPPAMIPLLTYGLGPILNPKVLGLSSFFYYFPCQWVVCSTPLALSPDALSPRALSPHALRPNGLRIILKNQA